MRLISQTRQRKLYAGTIDPGGDEKLGYYLSAIETARDNYRPLARYDTRQELEMEVNRRGCELIWQ